MLAPSLSILLYQLKIEVGSADITTDCFRPHNQSNRSRSYIIYQIIELFVGKVLSLVK